LVAQLLVVVFEKMELRIAVAAKVVVLEVGFGFAVEDYVRSGMVKSKVVEVHWSQLNHYYKILAQEEVHVAAHLVDPLVIHQVARHTVAVAAPD
jgi:hypothetical protein